MAKAVPSPAARRKAASKRIDAGAAETLPAHSFRTLLADLATLTRNRVRLAGGDAVTMLAAATPVQRRALELLGAAT